MRRPALYSSSRPARTAQSSQPTGAQLNAPGAQASAKPRIWRRVSPSNPKLLWSAIVLLAAMLALSISLSLRMGQRKLTQEDIDSAVLKTMETQVMPSEYARAYEKIQPSVVRVVSYIKAGRLRAEKEREKEREKEKQAALDPSKPKVKPKPPAPAIVKPADPKDDEEVEYGVGTGVVIIDKGVILTNLHVVSGADRIKVIFSDGLESEARITGVQAEDDLAVLQASKIPDDMIAATMRSTNDLAPGDKVLAVGFPFGIGPSASGGVVSGLKRAFRSPEGKQEMTNLIQFDAAANPGNSGGPLVTMDGEVVGIVTAILNPTPARTFLGIGFAVPIENAARAAGLPPF